MFCFYQHFNMGGERYGRSAPDLTYPRLAPHPVGQHIQSIYTDRLRQFTDTGQYKANGLASSVTTEEKDLISH